MKTVIEQIKSIIKESLKEIGGKYRIESENIQIEVEIPKEKKYGDYSTPIALKLGKSLKTNPLNIAKDLLDALNKNNKNFFKKIELIPPGFINFFISKEFLIQELVKIFNKKENYGKTDKNTSEKIIIEFVSANPTGPLNVVNARAASVGDAITNLFKFRGKNVYKEYYINDTGTQVFLLGKSVFYRIKQLLGENVNLPEDCYQGEYLIDIAKEILNNKNFYNEILKLTENEKINRLSEYTIKKIVKTHKEDLKLFNVEFDNWFSEKKLRESNALNECYKLLKEKDVIYKKEGKVFFKATLFGDEKDRVIIRADGTPTYFFVDIAYHLNKYRRGFTKIIDLWGPDHDGYIPRMKGAIKALGFNENSFMVLIVQQVNLIEKSQKIQMSKRAGKFVLMRELIEDIGKDAARFFFIHRSLNSHLDFDMELARKQSEENPVYYVQYAYARICSIFTQAKEKGIEFLQDPEKINLELLAENQEEMDLIKRLIDLPDTIKEASEKFQPSLLTNYLLSVSALFHKFYTEHRVLSDNKDITQARLFLVECTRIILKIAFDLIGISALERM